MSTEDDAKQLENLKHESGKSARKRKFLSDPDYFARLVNQKIADEKLVRMLVAERFHTGGESSGYTWPELAMSTALQRGKQGFHSFTPILVRSGALLNAATLGEQMVTADTITLMFRDGPAPIYIGRGKTRKNKKGSGGKMISSYADAHNEGRGKLPKRPFYGAPTEKELEPILRARNELIMSVLGRLNRNEGTSDLI